MANFWEYESKTTQQARDAESWAAKAKQDAAEWLGQQHAMSDGTPEEGVRPLSPGSVLAPDKGWDWTNNDTDSIQRRPDTKPKQSGGHSLLGSIGGFLDDAASTVFMGDVRQPWDLLRPVQRALEAEQKYVARPIAKAALSPLGDYDSLPGIVRAGAETIFDPLTYIGPGAVTDAFKAAKLAGGVKLAALALETLFTGPGSRRVLAHVAEQAGYGLTAVGGGTAAEALGLPGMVGSLAGPAAFGHLNRPSSTGQRIINPEDVRVYHGTTAEFEGLPSTKYATTKYGISVPESVYTSLNPDIAMVEGTGLTNMMTQANAREYAAGQRILPLTLKKGAKLFDPAQDPWPTKHYDPDDAHLFNEVEQVYKSGDLGGFYTNDTNSPVFDRLADWFSGKTGSETQGKELRNYLVDAIKKDGYEGIATPYEVIVFNEKVLEPAYKEPSKVMSMVGGKEYADMPPSLKSALKAEDADLEAFFKKPAKDTAKVAAQMDANIALSSSARGREIMAKKTKGDPLNGKDLEDMANLLNDARYPDCAES